MSSLLHISNRTSALLVFWDRLSSYCKKKKKGSTLLILVLYCEFCDDYKRYGMTSLYTVPVNACMWYQRNLMGL